MSAWWTNQSFWSTWPVCAHIYTHLLQSVSNLMGVAPRTKFHPNSFVEDAAHYYTPCFSKVELGVCWFRLISLSIICNNAVNFTVDVVLWTELCPHCIFQTSSQIPFIFTYLIDQLQKNFILSFWWFFFSVSKFEFFLNFLIHELARHVLASSGCQVI